MRDDDVANEIEPRGPSTNADAARGRVAADAAEVYEEFFVPALFGQWTEVMLTAGSVGPGDTVLDVGCGTGVLSRAASIRVGPAGSVVGVDPSPGMLAVAARSQERVDWQPGAAEHLPFGDDSFDRVLCQFALMFFDDRLSALREMARVVRPTGTIAVATWASVTESPGYAAMVDLIDRLVGADAADALLAPFDLGTAEVLGELVHEALPDATVTRHDGVARFDSIEAWLHTDIRGWTLNDMIDDDMYDRLRTAALDELAVYTDGQGRVRFPAPALITTAAGLP